jgi:hypothetical protein
MSLGTPSTAAASLLMKQYRELTDPKRAIPSFQITVSRGWAQCDTAIGRAETGSTHTNSQLDNDDIFRWYVNVLI